ncbi:MAG TPA: M56 family metallopeptidase [Kineosporiaceae bacterium]
MTAAGVVAGMPFLAAVLLAGAGPGLARWLPPATAVRVLTVLSLVTATACGFVLAATAFRTLAQLPVLAGLGHWSPAVLRQGEPLPVPAGAAVAVIVLVLLGESVRRAVTQGRQLADAELTCRRVGPGVDGLVVVDDEQPDAFTLAGLSGRIVVTTAMLKALPPPERRALLAHEASHLRHRHHAYNQLTDLAAAANPLLRSTARAVRLAVERWADEDAATDLADRATTARALARAGLTRATAQRRARPAARTITLTAAVGDNVPERTRALLAAPPRPRRTATAVLLTAALAVAASAVATGHDVERHFEHAHAAYTPPPAPAR